MVADPQLFPVAALVKLTVYECVVPLNPDVISNGSYLKDYVIIMRD